jgi:sugar phosphate isomerase/epimerase
MPKPNHLTRRRLLATTTFAAATVLPISARAQELVQPKIPERPRGDPWRGLKMGVATYSLRGLKVEEAIAGIQRVGLKYASIKDVHLRLEAPQSWRHAVVRKFKEAGIALVSCGVVTLVNDEASVRKAFEYARDISVPVIVCSPHPDSFPLLDKMVKEFDIRLAIHNHGPTDKRFPTPYDALKAAEPFDERIGLCIDVGHTARAGVDVAECIRKCKGRLYDVHLKDVSNPRQRGPEVELGRGDLDVPAMLRALLEIDYAYHVGIEHEKDPKDPLPGLAESVGYAKGTLAVRT